MAHGVTAVAVKSAVYKPSLMKLFSLRKNNNIVLVFIWKHRLKAAELVFRRLSLSALVLVTTFHVVQGFSLWGSDEPDRFMSVI